LGIAAVYFRIDIPVNRTEKRITVPMGTVNDIVQPHWSARVTVKVLHRKGRHLDLLEITPVEENSDDTAERN
jgi:hypothetical protein